MVLHFLTQEFQSNFKSLDKALQLALFDMYRQVKHALNCKMLSVKFFELFGAHCT